MKAQGYCPMGCGQTLTLTNKGTVRCEATDCPRPGAVDALLGDPETEHIVGLDGEGFAIQHPLRERLDGGLFNCRLHAWLRKQSGPPARPGRYRVIESADPAAAWEFEQIPDQ